MLSLIPFMLQVLTVSLFRLRTLETGTRSALSTIVQVKAKTIENQSMKQNKTECKDRLL